MERVTRDDGTESFKMLERTYGRVTAIFCRIGEDYYTLSDFDDFPHAEIVARCRAVRP